MSSCDIPEPRISTSSGIADNRSLELFGHFLTENSAQFLVMPSRTPELDVRFAIRKAETVWHLDKVACLQLARHLIRCAHYIDGQNSDA